MAWCHARLRWSKTRREQGPALRCVVSSRATVGTAFATEEIAEALKAEESEKPIPLNQASAPTWPDCSRRNVA